MRPAVFTWPATDADAICLAQTLAAAGALTINGVLLEPAGTTFGAFTAIMPGIERVVTVTAAGDVATVTFTITGKNLRGETVTDTVTGVNANTVAGDVPFHTVTSVTADDAAADVSVGTGETGSTNWYICDTFANPFNIGWGVDVVSGTVDIDVQYTLDDVQTDATPVTGDIDNNVAADTTGVFTTPSRAVRANYGGTTNTGSFVLTFIQTG